MELQKFVQTFTKKIERRKEVRYCGFYPVLIECSEGLSLPSAWSCLLPECFWFKPR